VLPREAALRRLPLGLGRGLVMEIDPGRDARFWLGLYEVELASHVRALCGRGSSGFDLGAESGFYALVFAKRGGGRVVAVEANARTCERLQRNIEANPSLAPTVEVIHGRVARRTNTPSGAVSIDDLAYRAGGFLPDLVKLDVEGKEVAALRGATRLLTERRPHFIVETHSQELDTACHDLLSDHGYEITAVEPRRWVPEVRTASFNRWLVARGEMRRR
jgi:Methyltransferase FkbM domain